jgi:dipeptide transport system ATP-binding protein
MTAPIVVADSLVQIYPVPRGFLRAPAALKAVNGVSFVIESGRTLAVVGDSGCGKSTLARMVSMIERPAAGTLAIGGLDALSASPKDRRLLRRQVQVVFQNPFGSLNPRRRIDTILEEPLAVNSGLPKAERRMRAGAMLARVGLGPEHGRRYPHMFSGGQRQRIAIARALMLEPRLVVADEPTSALDVSVQAQILNLLLDLQRDLGIAYLFISHDLAVVRRVAHDLLVMYLGHAVEQGAKDVVLDAPLHPYTRALLAATPKIGAGGAKAPPLRGELPSPLDPPAGCVFSTRCPYATDRCVAERPRLRRVGGRRVACHYAESFLDPAGAQAGRA